MSVGNLEFIDGGALHYDENTTRLKWNQYGPWTRMPTSSPWGGPCIRSSGGLGYTLTYGPPDELWQGARGRYVPISGNTFGSFVHIFPFFDTGTVQVVIGVQPDGHIAAYRNAAGNPANLLGQSTVAIHINTWYYFEAYVKIHPSAGAVIVRLNNVEIINVTGVNTRFTTENQITHVQLGGGLFAGMQSDWCDYYVHKTQFLGDIRIGLMKPNADNTNSGWSLSTGANVWELVDEVPPNQSDYVFATAAGSKFYTEMEDTVLTGPCLGIQVLTCFEKEDSGDRRGKTVIVEGGTETDGVESPIVATPSQLYARDTYDVNPRTSAQWTEAQLNAIKAGGLLSV